MTSPFVRMMRRDETDLFDSDCTITADGGRGALNETTGEYDADPGDTTVYDGACLLRPADGVNARQVQLGQQEVSSLKFEVKVEADVAVQRGHVLNLTASPDAALAGKTFVVSEVPYDDWQVTRRFIVELAQEQP